MQERPEPPDSVPQYLVDGLERQDVETLEDVQIFVDELLEYARTVPDSDDLPDDAEVVDVNEETGKTIVKERVKCGSDCTCNNGQGHGPYLYSYQRDADGTLISKYEGKPD